VEPIRLTPAGRVPAVTLQVYGGVPLVAERDAAYVWVRTPDGRAAVATIGDGGEAITIWTSLLPVMPIASVTVNVGVKVPSAVGVPERTPVGAIKLTLSGRVPAVTLQVYGGVPLVAERDAVNGWVRTPEGRDVVETEGGGGGWITSVSDV
jgi:hypothetical protein